MGDVQWLSGGRTVPNMPSLTDEVTSKAYTDVGDSMDFPLATGEAICVRGNLNTNAAPVAGQLCLVFFTARKSETITQIRVPSGGTARSGTPTLQKLAVFTEDPTTKDIARVAITASDTALFAAASTEYTKAFLASFSKVAGQRYAVGFLQVGGTTPPTFYYTAYAASQIMGTMMNRAPRIASLVASQTDIGSSYTSAQLDGGVNLVPHPFYAELLP